MIIVRIWRIHSVAAPDDISLVTALLITNACIVQPGIIPPEMEDQGGKQQYFDLFLCNAITLADSQCASLLISYHALRCRPG